MAHHDDHANRAQLIRIWTERLYVEYDNILYHYRIKLRPPVIRVEDLSSVWGQWDQTTRCLTISRRLIESYSWDIVIEVLKHEMAHQIVHEIFGVRELHGPHFKRACARLSVAPWAAAASGELPHDIPRWQDRCLSDEEERLLKKVEKLLSLAESANEHEASLAMQRVQQLYAKYNIERLKANRLTAMTYCVITHRKKRFETPESIILSILTEHFFVRCIYTSLYDAEDLCEYKAVELLGTPENVMMAEYVYHFLRTKLQQLWNDYSRRTGKRGARVKRSYVLGVLAGFRDKLAASKAQTETDLAAQGRSAAECRALLKVGDQELDRYTQHRHPRLTSKRVGHDYSDRASYAAGVSDGGTITISKGLSRSDGNGGKLLGCG